MKNSITETQIVFRGTSIYDRMQPDMSYVLAIMQQPGKIKQAKQVVNKKAPVQSSLTTRTH